MKRNTLKLILNGQKVSKDVCREEYDNNSWWYLHGKLEHDIGYDKARAINCKSLGISKETKCYSSISGNGKEYEIELYNNDPWYEMHYTGILNVDIEGISKRCIGYFWVTDERIIDGIDDKFGHVRFSMWSQRGLVCYADDIEARKYAERRYNSRTSNI